MAAWDDLDEDDGDMPDGEEDLDDVLTNIIVEHLAKERIPSPDFEIYQSIFVDMFVNAEPNCTEIANAYIFGVLDVINIRYLTSLALITNAFHTLNIGLDRPDKNYLQTSKRILKDLNVMLGEQDIYIKTLYDNFELITMLAREIISEEDSRISDRFTFSNRFMADYDGHLYVDFFEFQKTFAIEDSPTIYPDTSRPIRSKNSEFVLKFIRTYHDMSEKRPTHDLLQLAIYSAESYDISNHLLLHELLRDEINEYKGDECPIPSPNKRIGYSEELLKAGIIENLNALCEMYRNGETPTLGQEMNERSAMYTKLAIDMEILRSKFQHKFGFMPLKVSDVAVFADAYIVSVNTLIED
jgi:hypothetical protein